MKKILLFLLAMAIFPIAATHAEAASRFWVAGTGNWSDNTNHWASVSNGAPGATTPSASDDCFFNGSSFSGAGQIVTVDTPATCLSMDWTGATNSPTLAGSSTLTISANLTFIAAMSVTQTGGITFNATTTGKTITTATLAIPETVTFNGAGGGWTFQDALNITSTSNSALSIKLTATVDFGSFTHNIAGSIRMDQDGSARTIKLNSSTFNIGSGAAANNVPLGITSNNTFNANSATFNVASITVNLGINNTGNVNGASLTIGSLSAILNFGAASGGTWNNLTVTGAASQNAQLYMATAVTYTGTVTINGNSISNRVRVGSATTGSISRGTPSTITAAGWTLTNVDFEDITAAGAGTFPSAGTSSVGNLGGNSGTFVARTTNNYYWVADTGNYSDTTKWSLTSGGSSASTIPLPQDTAFFNANSFTGASKIVTFDVAHFSSIDWTGATNTPKAAFNSISSIVAYGAFILNSNMTVTAGTTLTLEGRGTYDYSPQAIANPFTSVRFDTITGTVNQRSTGNNSTWQFDSGTYNTNNNTIFTTNFQSTGTNTRVLNLGSSTIRDNGTSCVNFSGSGLTFNAQNSVFQLNPNGLATCTMGSLTYNDVQLLGTNTVVISGSNSFRTLTGTAAARTVQFTAGTTQTIRTRDGFLKGAAGAIQTLQSTSSPSTWAVTSPYRQNLDYLSIQDSVATEVNNWFAGNHSTNAGNNTNWTFTAADYSVAPATSYWKFNEGTGTSTRDSSDQNNVGTLAGTTIPTWQTEDACISGKCLFFNGITSNVTTSTISKTVNSLSFWVRPASSSASLLQLAAGVDVRATAGTVTATGFTSPTVYVNGHAAATGFTANQWNHVVITTASAITANSVTLGKMQTGVLQGFLDEVRFFNYVRTAAQIKSDYNAGKSHSQAEKGVAVSLGSNGYNSDALSNGLTGYWKLDEASWNGTSNEVLDYSGNARHGTSSGSSNTGTSTGSNTTTTLNDTGKSWVTNAFANYNITLTGGTGSGQTRLISSNTATAITVSTAWSPTPDATSTYRLTPSTVPGHFGNAGIFGSDTVVISYVDVPTTTAFDVPVGGAITMAAWVKITTCNSGANYIMVRLNGNSVEGIETTGSGCTPATFFRDANGLAASLTGTGAISTGVWHHIVGTYNNNTGYSALYIDGALNKSSVTKIGAISPGVDLTIGSRTGQANVTTNGLVDDARVYSRDLSAAEVRTLYNFAPGPAGYWPFDDGQGTTVADRSTNANTGTWSGSGTSRWTSGKYGKAGNFTTAGGDFVTIADNASLDLTTNFTIMGWIKSTASGSQILYISGSQASKWEVTMISNKINFTEQGILDNPSNTTLVANTWYHFAIVKNGDSGTNLTFYLNGVPDGTAAVDTVTTPSGSKTINSSGNTFGGLIDDFKIYNYPRSQSQILQDMSTGVSEKLPNAYWKFDEGYGTTAHDETVNNNVGTLTTSPTWVSGKLGRAINFSPASSFVTVPSSTSLNITGDISYEAWVKPTTIDSTARIVMGKGDNAASSSRQYSLRLNSSNQWQGFVYSGSTTFSVADPTTVPSTSRWDHIVIVRDSTAGTLKIYTNGVLKNSSSNVTGALNSTSNALAIGREGVNSSSYFGGQIDEVKIYPYVLTPDEIKLEFDGGKSISLGALGSNSNIATQSANQIYCIPGDVTTCTAPVGEWNFEEGQGTTVNDTSGTGNTGTFNGTVPLWGSGKIGKSGQFNGTDDYVDVGNSSSERITGALTTEAWIKLNNNSSIEQIIGKRGTAISYGLHMGATGKLIMAVSNDGSATVNATGNTTLATGVWYHVVGVYIPSTSVTVYLNGVQDGQTTTSVPATLFDASTTDLNIGARGGPSAPSPSNFLSGQIDQAKLFNYARTAAQVAYDYNRGIPIAWWKMNECSGTTIHDSIGGSVGTLTVGASGTQTSAGTCAGASALQAWSNGATGKINASLNFDGTDDYVDVGDMTSTESQSQLSWSLWVYHTSNISSLTCLLCKFNNDNTQTSWFLQSRSNGGFNNTLLIGVPTGASDGNTFGSTAANSLPINTWMNLAVVFDGTLSGNSNRLKAYLNGVPVTFSAFTGTIPASTTATTSNARIGSSSDSSRFFTGQIDDARIFNYPLTASQVKTLYNGGAAVRFAPVTGAP